MDLLHPARRNWNGLTILMGIPAVALAYATMMSINRVFGYDERGTVIDGALLAGFVMEMALGALLLWIHRRIARRPSLAALAPADRECLLRAALGPTIAAALIATPLSVILGQRDDMYLWIAIMAPVATTPFALGAALASRIAPLPRSEYRHEDAAP